MAHRPVALSTRGGITAALFVVAVILAALAAVAARAEWGRGLSPSDWAALRFTLWQAFLSALFSVLLAVPLARALARRTFPGRQVLVTLLGAPFILPVIVAVLGLLAVFGRGGWINALLASMGLPPLSIYGLQGVVLAHVFFNLPLATRLLLQGWQQVPAERVRLAAQLGLSPAALFRAVELPILRQLVPGVASLIFVLCLTSFAVALTLGGGPSATTIELAIYQAFLFDFDLGRAALLSVLQLTVAGAAAVAALWVLPEGGIVGGQDRGQRRWDARGGLTRTIDGGLIALAALFLLLPLVALVGRGVTGLLEMPAQVWQAAGVSILVALLSICLLLLLALPLSGWIATRRFGAVEAVGLLGLAASPLMIGTGWFIMINPFADPSLLALPVTALVNALMALPFALRILVPPLRDTVRAYGPLAQTLGLRGFWLWRWLVLPRLSPQIGFAAGLTGALSVGDLGVITLFADPDRATLPLQMYRLMGAYRMEAAAGAALLLLALALVFFYLCDWGGRRFAAT
ncbi:MAG: thiamine/thiamine pyrophosphate ABC transporter permease ThiP [Sulfitobacter sp.]|nr:thiamine/thiamine pyrophosphate ABC transporter permease ThiP [Sulfitobacter sp.]